MDSFLPFFIFIVVLAGLELGYFALRAFRSSERKEVRTRLRALASQTEDSGAVDILKKQKLSEIPWLHQLLSRLSVAGGALRLIERAGGERTPGFYILISVTLAVVGFLVGTRLQSAYFPLVPSLFIRVLFVLGMGILPYLYLRYKSIKRLRRFEAQLPEALDLIARSLRAGHAFSSGLRLVSEEMDDPIRTEFAKTLNEINFGIATQDALINTANRIPLDDLRFFVISVILQRETGGNLAEILENLARLIRERFKLHGHVRVLSSQARLSAYILVAVPFVTALVIHVINPHFFDAFFENPSGKYVLGAGTVWMVIGILVMKRVISIRA